MPSTLERTLIVASSQAVSCDLEGETVILDSVSGKYFALDAVATRIWQWIRVPCTVESVYERAMSEYNVSQDRCAVDISEFIKRLQEQGLIELTSCGAK